MGVPICQIWSAYAFFFQTNIFNGYVLRLSCGQVEYVDVTVYSTEITRPPPP